MNAEAEALKAEGNKLVGVRDWAGAAEKYKAAIACDPTKAAYHSNLAVCHEKMGDIAAFKDAARKCIEVDPTFIKGYYRLSKAHGLLWEFGEQVDVLKRGLEVEDSANSDLLKMLDYAKQHFDHMAAFEEVILECSESEPMLKVLGGGDSNTLPRDTTYSALERRQLPPLSNKKHANLMQFDENVRPVMESFYTGTLKIKWLCPPDSKGEPDCIEIDGYLQDESVPVISYKGRKIPSQPGQFMPSQPGESLFPYGYGFQTAQHIAYDKALDGREKQHLCIVMMLRFLAAKGSQLGMNGDYFSAMVDGLAKMCIQNDLHNDFVYAKLLSADVAFSQGYDKKILKVIKVAEALEAANGYREAGDMYCEATDAEKFTQVREAPSMLLHSYAGLAYKRAQDYVSAEREYVTALREAGPNWSREIMWGDCDGVHVSYDDRQAENTLANMMIFYEIAHRAVASGLKTDEAHKRMQRACHLLVGLLHVAQYDHDGNTMFDRPKVAQLCLDALKPEYKNSRERAREAVVHATMAPTIDEYHQRLLDCMVYDESHFVTVHTPAEQEEMQADLLERQRINSQESARNHVFQFGW